jgi:hypothetical protein
MIRALGLTVLLATAPWGCSSQGSPPDRSSVPTPNEGDAGRDADAARTPPDFSGGRDDKASSCYAACQNVSFTCQAKGDSSLTFTTADLAAEETGCSGTLTAAGGPPQAVAMKVDCSTGKICKGEAPGQPATSCASGTFSAFSFAYAPSPGGAMNVCTRN